MAPDAAATATLLAAAASKRPAADQLDSLPPPLDFSPPSQGGDGEQEELRKKQQKQQEKLECPRCRSTNTKFCYYNNYSTTQPRHFCRACRRYWTHGGTLRDVPVGGACRRRGSGGSKRRRVDGSSEPSSGSPPPTSSSARAEDDGADQLTSLGLLFPFLNDGGAFLPPQLSLGVAPAAFSWATTSAAVSDMYYDGLNLAAPWDVAGTRGDAVTGAWDNFADIAGLDLSWPPQGY